VSGFIINPYRFAAPAGGTDPFTNWSEYDLGTAPDDWTYLYITHDVETVSEEGALGGVIRRDTPLGTGAGIATWDRAGAAKADVEVLVKLKMNSDTNFGQSVVLRANNHAEAGSFTAYEFVARQKTRIRLFRLTSSTAQTYVTDGSSVTALADGAYAWMRCRVNGTTLTGKFWGDGNSEPASWQFSVTDENLASGALGLRVQAAAGAARDCDYFSYALDGGTAPGPS